MGVILHLENHVNFFQIFTMMISEIPIQESDVQCDKKIPLTEHIPLQKGLIHSFIFFYNPYFSALTEHIPLQKGLRLFFARVGITCKDLTEHIPLQKGLRLKIEF